MILFVNPRATKPVHRRFPLSVMSLGAALPEGTSWEIWDGNKPEPDFADRLVARIEKAEGSADPVRLLAITVMPGPQTAVAVPLTKRLKERFPKIPIVWGGYFPTLYPKPVLHSPHVDWAVRGQGEKTLVELIEVVDGKRDPATVAGLSYLENGVERVNPERAWVAPDDLPSPPYDRIDVADYLEPTFLGKRSGVYQASFGCPYTCSFCGVIDMWGSREKFEDPARTAANLEFLVKRHGMDSVHFYDSNFFLKEPHAEEIAARLTPLGLSWWCEARIDVMLRFSGKTWERLKASGLRMIFFGAESGSNEALRKMSKNLTVEQTLELAGRIRTYGITPEFSFVVGGPDDPEEEIDATLGLIRTLKNVNPACEIILYYYTPTPQRRATYGNVDPYAGTPDTLEEWAAPEWVEWSSHTKPLTSWMSHRLGARVTDFELVLKSRFPSLHDRRTHEWGKTLGRLLSKRRWEKGDFRDPRLLRQVRTWARIPPEDKQLYGHLRPQAGG